MTTTTLAVGCSVIAGEGAAQALPAALKRRSISRVLIVTGSAISRSAIAQRVQSSLESAGIDALRYERAFRHPMLPDVERAAEVLGRERRDAVVAIGGGSSIDLGKVAALVAAEGGPAERHAVAFEGGQVRIPVLTAPKVPIVAVPTTFSGSEGNGSGQIRGGSGRYARSFRDDAVAPAIVVLDPIAGDGQSPFDAVASALNALAHAVDSLFTRDRSPFSDALAHQASRALVDALPELALEPATPSARLSAQWASLLAGIVIRHAYVGFHHALCHSLVSLAGLAHPVANAILLPSSVAWRCRHSADARDQLAAMLPAGWDDRIGAAVKRVGLPASLREAGVPESTLAAVAQDAVSDRCMASERVMVGEAALLQVLRQAYGVAAAETGPR